MRSPLVPIALATSLLACSPELEAGPPQPAQSAANPSGPFMPGVISTAANEYNLSVDDTGTLMVFARSEANFANSHILVMTKQGSRWSEPAPLSFSDPQYRDSDPWLTPDGAWLYFASARPAAGREADRKDRDIWRARHNGNGTWSTPEHLPAVSSPAEDLGPELHGTTAYFWSTRDGKGQIYAAQRMANGWATPHALSPQVNDGDFAFTPNISRNGDTLTYASTRLHAGQPAGMADIYHASLR